MTKKTMIEQLSGSDGSLASLARGKGFAGAASLLTIGAVLWPIVENWRKEPKDSFPLSYYPMFSVKRSKRAKVYYFVGLDAQGERHLLPYTYAGAGGLNQVRRQIRRVVREGGADRLCQTLAVKVARETKRFTGVVTVQVVTGEYRLTDYFTGKRDPVSELIHASRQVERDFQAASRGAKDLV